MGFIEVVQQEDDSSFTGRIVQYTKQIAATESQVNATKEYLGMPEMERQCPLPDMVVIFMSQAAQSQAMYMLYQAPQVTNFAPQAHITHYPLFVVKYFTGVGVITKP